MNTCYALKIDLESIECNGTRHFNIELVLKTLDYRFCERLKALIPHIIEVCEGKEMEYIKIK